MQLGQFQDAVYMTPIAGSTQPLRMLETVISQYNKEGVSADFLGKMLYTLACICNTYDYDLNDSAWKFLADARKFHVEEDV
jgi:hypothetical protein